MTAHSYLAELAGKRSYAHENNLGDVFRGTNPRLTRELLEDVNQAMREQRFAAVILDNYFSFHSRHPMLRFEAFRNHYRREPGEIFADESVFYPITGGQKRPLHVFVPR